MNICMTGSHIQISHTCSYCIVKELENWASSSTVEIIDMPGLLLNCCSKLVVSDFVYRTFSSCWPHWFQIRNRTLTVVMNMMKMKRHTKWRREVLYYNNLKMDHCGRRYNSFVFWFVSLKLITIIPPKKRIFCAQWLVLPNQPIRIEMRE